MADRRAFLALRCRLLQSGRHKLTSPYLLSSPSFKSAENQSEVHFVATDPELKTFRCVVPVENRSDENGLVTVHVLQNVLQQVLLHFNQYDDTTGDPVPVFESKTVNFSPENYTIEYGFSTRFESQSIGVENPLKVPEAFDVWHDTCPRVPRLYASLLSAVQAVLARLTHTFDPAPHHTVASFMVPWRMTSASARFDVNKMRHRMHELVAGPWRLDVGALAAMNVADAADEPSSIPWVLEENRHRRELLSSWERRCAVELFVLRAWKPWWNGTRFDVGVYSMLVELARSLEGLAGIGVGDRSRSERVNRCHRALDETRTKLGEEDFWKAIDGMVVTWPDVVRTVADAARNRDADAASCADAADAADAVRDLYIVHKVIAQRGGQEDGAPLQYLVRWIGWDSVHVDWLGALEVPNTVRDAWDVQPQSAQIIVDTPVIDLTGGGD